MPNQDKFKRYSINSLSDLNIVYFLIFIYSTVYLKSQINKNDTTPLLKLSYV